MIPHPLLLILLSPLVSALLVMLVPRRNLLAIRLISALGTSVSLLVSLWVAFAFDRASALNGQQDLQFVERLDWLPGVGISFFLGVDGVNLSMVLLTAIVIFCGVFASWTVTYRTKEFYCLLLLLVTGVFGVFVSQDLFFFFLFYELAVLPMYLLIGIWGTGPKEYSAMKLTLYLLAGSAFMLVGIFGMYFSAHWPGATERTFSLPALTRASYAPAFQSACFLLLYIGFGILAGIWPLHTWSPDGHSSAPTAVSMLHAGVLMKLGAYGVLRVGLACLPEGARHWAWLVGTIGVINIIYGAYVAMGQRDLKYVIAYSSVSHMGVVMLGCAALNQISLNGAVMQMFSHGIMTALFFALVGLVYEKSHTRNIEEMGGLARRMPGIAAAFTIGGLASFGVPGTSGFVAEIMVFLGAIRAHRLSLEGPGYYLLGIPLFLILAIGAVIAIVVTATYVLRVLQKVFHGPMDEQRFREVPDARTTEWVTLAFCGAVLILVGLIPWPLTNLIGSSLGVYLR
jgi:NADH-quinone oxidoreductase subunit M